VHGGFFGGDNVEIAVAVNAVKSLFALHLPLPAPAGTLPEWHFHFKNLQWRYIWK
jgi:hypothetical protein